LFVIGPTGGDSKREAREQEGVEFTIERPKGNAIGNSKGAQQRVHGAARCGLAYVVEPDVEFVFSAAKDRAVSADDPVVFEDGDSVPDRSQRCRSDQTSGPRADDDSVGWFRQLEPPLACHPSMRHDWY